MIQRMGGNTLTSSIDADVTGQERKKRREGH